MDFPVDGRRRGNWGSFPQVKEINERLSLGSTNILLAVGLILMMYPPLAKVDYSLLPKALHFIDCGHTRRREVKTSFQLWFANDYEHRLTSEKFLKIIEASSSLEIDPNAEITVEYQTDLSLSIFHLEFIDGIFHLIPIEAACLVIDQCGIPTEKKKISLADLKANNCTPNSGCC